MAGGCSPGRVFIGGCLDGVDISLEPSGALSARGHGIIIPSLFSSFFPSRNGLYFVLAYSWFLDGCFDPILLATSSRQRQLIADD
jgi:hypothetical protein